MLPHPVVNDQTLMLVNFECLFLLSPLEIKQEVCILLMLISQGIDWYKVLVVGKSGKLNETIEVSALWSIWEGWQSLQLLLHHKLRTTLAL